MSPRQVPLDSGASATFVKTVTEADVVLFAGISGDFAPVHMDAEYARKSALGQRVAHGALTLAFMSTAASKLTTACAEKTGPRGPTALSLGFDKVRFLKPVYFGDTLTTTYTVEAIDSSREIVRTIAKVEVRNQHGDLAAAATHIEAWVPGKD